MNKRYKNIKKSISKVIPKIKRIDKLLDTVGNDKLIKPNFQKYKRKNFKKTKYAYATTVFINEDYIPGCLALAHSLDIHNNNYNKVCLVQYKPTYKEINGKKTYFPGISKETIRNLLKLYDIVYGINLLQITNTDKNNNHWTKMFKHYKNISIYPTKCQVFGLIEYDRVLYIDASSIVNKNLNYIFKKYKGNTFLWDKEFNYTNMGLDGSFFYLLLQSFFHQNDLYGT